MALSNYSQTKLWDYCEFCMYSSSSHNYDTYVYIAFQKYVTLRGQELSAQETSAQNVFFWILLSAQSWEVWFLLSAESLTLRNSPWTGEGLLPLLAPGLWEKKSLYINIVYNHRWFNHHIWYIHMRPVFCIRRWSSAG